MTALGATHAAPTGLMCDLLVSPELTEIATTTPTFGWVVNAGRPGPAQRAYEILVRAVGRLSSPGYVGWKSGRVDSSRSVSIVYGGAPLAKGGTYEWQVRTWPAGEGGPSPWSAAQRFMISCRADSAQLAPVSVYPLITTRIAPASLRSVAAGMWAIDFSRQAFGWLELEIDSVSDGRTVAVGLGEAWKDGALDRSPPGSVRYAEVVLATRAGRHVYQVRTPADARNTGLNAIKLPAEVGVVLPFRYAEVEVGAGQAEGVDLLGATLVRVQYPFDESAASFASSSPVLDEVWELCRYTIMATTFAGYYVDGDRERIPYEADAYINQLGHYATDREFSLARRTHEHLFTHPTWPTEWKQHSILIAWADYEATGDDRLLRRHYETLKNEKLLTRHAREDGLLATGRLRDPALGRSDVGDLVDWPPVERDGFEFCDVNTVVNALHHRTLVLMARIARVLDRQTDAERFSSEAERVCRRFNDVLFDEARGVYVDGEGSAHVSQHGNLFPLAFGLVPPDRQASVVAYVKSRGVACSVYPVQYLLEGLFEAREAEHAIALMAGGGLRSWRNMLHHGATLTWEAWDQSLKPNQDWNHAWGAAPANILPRYVLGVRPLEPGYGRVLIDPQLGDLTEARGVVPTIRGPIHVRAWRDENGGLRCAAHAPANIGLEYAPHVFAQSAT